MAGAISGNGDEAPGKQEIQAAVPTWLSYKFRLFGQVLQPEKYWSFIESLQTKAQVPPNEEKF
jgi:hypothetical protein